VDTLQKIIVGAVAVLVIYTVLAYIMDYGKCRDLGGVLLSNLYRNVCVQELK
jgi:hypothetical protein